MTQRYSLPVASGFTGHLHVMQPAKLAFMERCEQEFPLGRFRLYHVRCSWFRILNWWAKCSFAGTTISSGRGC